ncbi:hypothetical protein M2132_000829 [Dysgonomonas sp. PH5-45]|uniref:hypothetical protein n=1 Tax=unclassified Dysgonomonas TaxID=2630389 RepID=UPI00247548DC|nr:MULTISPECIES: hypothetical protein [unclassified Dysgonomonas]MDH6354501.1 hypothetical protein [Dysgonomonas sp. PH5-45]MDH6387442.1 hypothetical protein [Dysgonomonas sp. PH5-37]
MKKLIFAIACAACVLSACNNKKTAEEPQTYAQFQNEEQNRFCSLIDASLNGKMKPAELEEKMLGFIDSMVVFNNWKGTIKDVNIKDELKLEFKENYDKILSFTITVKDSGKVDQDFYYARRIPFKKVKTDHIYNTVKDLTNGTEVYFDGIVEQIGFKISYKNDTAATKTLPAMDFTVTDISTAERPQALSTNVKRVVEIYSIFGRNKKEKKDWLNKELQPEADSLIKLLTPQEKIYSDYAYDYFINGNVNADKWVVYVSK